MTGLSPKAQETLARWLQDPSVDENTKEELKALAGEPKELEERFYRDLEFGTGGLRGVIGAGSNRMNRYTVGRATQGFADYILGQHTGEGRPSVVVPTIPGASRRNSRWRLRLYSPATELRPTCSLPCAPRRSCPLPSVI